MRFRVLALDYDGTMAEGGVADPDALAAVEEIRARGIAAVLVTGRRLDELRRVAGDLRFLDAVVAEGGAVAFYPDSERSFTLAPPVSPVLLEELRRRDIPAAAGQCVVETPASFAPEVLSVIRQRELPLVLLFNRGRLMVLPQSVSKATGLRDALATLRLSTHNALGVGDAENDHALLEACEVGVAVGWGSPALEAAADTVLEGEGPAALAPYLREVAGWARLPRARASRRGALLGDGPDGAPVVLPLHDRNVLVAGDPGSGKSWVTGLLCEQLVLAHYSVCVIDPEGDYASLEALPGVVVLGHDSPPTLRDVERAVRFPDVSVVIDLSAMPPAERLEYVPSLLAVLASARRQRGFPHRTVVDEAHYFLHGPSALEVLDLELAAYTLATYRVASLDPSLLEATEAIIVTHESDPVEARALHAALGGHGAEEAWRRSLAGLATDEAVLVHTQGPARGRLQRFRTAPRLTPHVRHRHKYTDVPVAPADAFVFTRDGAPVGPAARTLTEFSHLLGACPPEALEGHLRRHDFSRWIARVFRDRTLASRVFDLEVEGRRSPAPGRGLEEELARIVSERYRLPAFDAAR